ncbi:MAG: methyltransferase domain-containing protein [Anaerotignum sp.]|nr:methyltransferase domain-containing protein [Anaerotignum sp.]
MGSYEFLTFEEKRKKIDELNKIIYYEKDNIRNIIQRFNMSGKILDIGCGPGTSTKLLAKNMQTAEIFGVDVDEYFLAYAEKYHSANNVQYVVGNVFDLPFPDDTFDFCYARYVFQHIANPLEALLEIKRVTKPKGGIIIHDFDYDLLKTVPDFPILKKLKKTNARLKAFRGGDAYVGRKLLHYMEQAALQNIETVMTYTNTNQDRNFLELFYNPDYDDCKFIINNKLMSVDEYRQMKKAINEILNNENSFFEIGNYCVLGIKGE